MKVVLFGPERRLGAIAGEQVIDLVAAGDRLAPGQLQQDLAAFIAGGDRTLDAAARIVDGAASAADPAFCHKLADVKLHRPEVVGARIACAGGNFARHSAGMRSNEGQAPATYEQMVERIRGNGFWGFWKVSRAGAGPDDDVMYPARTERLDYEGEAAVVIGSPAKDVSAAQARSHIWGVTLHIDWSIRDKRDPAMPLNFALSKNFDGSSSLGPCIVVGELDPHDLAIETRVNGELRQQYNSGEMVFSFEEYIEYLSRDHTLFPGDIISGGTGAGTAMDSSPRDEHGVAAPDRFLKPGDSIEVSSPGIGSLRNRVVAKRASA
jgi:acylpyruvate hydrolase